MNCGPKTKKIPKHNHKIFIIHSKKKKWGSDKRAKLHRYTLFSKVSYDALDIYSNQDVNQQESMKTDKPYNSQQTTHSSQQRHSSKFSDVKLKKNNGYHLPRSQKIS